MIKKISAVILPYALSDGDIRFSICAKKVSGCSLTLRRPNFIGAHVPVAPDLAKTVKMG